METQKLTTELLATGLTQQQLADLLGCSQSTINSFLSGKRGSRPSFSIARALIALHAERCHPHQNRANPTEQLIRETAGLGVRLTPNVSDVK